MTCRSHLVALLLLSALLIAGPLHAQPAPKAQPTPAASPGSPAPAPDAAKGAAPNPSNLADPAAAPAKPGDPTAPTEGMPAQPQAPGCTRFTDCPQGQTCLVPKGACQLAVIDCEQWGGYCAHFKDKCASGYVGSDPMHCPLGRSATCCLPSTCSAPTDCGPVRWCYEGTCGPLGNCKTADDCVPQPLEKLICPGAWKCIEGECEYRCGD